MDDRADFPQLSKRLLDRRGEIWQAVLSRAHQVAAVPANDAAYKEGMRAAALAAIDYGRDVLAAGEEGLPATPSQLLAQARLAAASGVGVDSVVRRYFGGYAAFIAVVIEEAHRCGLSPEAVQQVMSRQAEALDRLISAVTNEYAEEATKHLDSNESRRLRLIGSLLAGTPVDSGELGYELGQSHIGVVTSSPRPKALLLDLGRQVDRQVLVAHRSHHETWAWLGGRNKLERKDLERVLARVWPKASPLALGEDCKGAAGWRLTHRQALRSWPSAIRDPAGIVRYRHVALSSAILQDEDLVSFLRQAYLTPLSGKEGASLCATLRAYFSTGGNVSSTAATLAVSRQTVTNRLRQAEARLGEQISNCRVELECALRLEVQHDQRLSAVWAA
jgi:PucR C-terminal helix-turn-helix domain